jgi:sterol 24-C-methyltransferase
MLGAYVHATGAERLWYRLSTTAVSFWRIINLNSEDVNRFMGSYEIFGKEKIVTAQDEQNIINYYRVLTHLCALGPVEKMYIPPVYDMSRGVVGNQLMFEEKVAALLEVTPGQRILDVGCGRGRVAHHIAELTGAKVVGINIDKDQVESAIQNAKASGLLGKQLEFKVGSFNDPLPFEDASFDALYNIQAWTYVKDLKRFFKELARVLKPGAKLSTLDWFMLDAFDAKNATHVQILERTKTLIGAVYTPHPREYHEAMIEAGFEILSSREASDTGHQYPLIAEAEAFFAPFGRLVKFLCSWGILPQHTNDLLERLNLYKEDFQLADRLGLSTSSYHIVARKK